MKWRAAWGGRALAAWALAALASIASTPVAAQTAATEAAQADCELHVWPGSSLRSTYYGWFHGGIVDGAVNGREGYTKLPANPLDTARQRELLAKVDIPAALGLAAYKAVLHDVALDSRTMRSSTKPWAEQRKACHAEIAIDDAFFQEDIVTGRFLKVIYRFRKYASGETPERSFGQIIAVKLFKFPATKPEDDPAAAFAELGDAFSKSVKDFGTVLQSPPKKKK